MEQDITIVRISFCNHTLKKQNSMQSNGEKVINKTLLMQRCLLMDQRVIEKDERNIYYALLYLYFHKVLHGDIFCKIKCFLKSIAYRQKYCFTV